MKHLTVLLCLLLLTPVSAQLPVSDQQSQTPLIDSLMKEIETLRLPVPPVLSLRIPVPAGANLQAAVDAALPGSTLLLEQRATFKVNLLLRNKVGNGVVTIRTEGLDDTVLKPGVRVTALDPSVVKMAKLECLDCLFPTLAADAGAHDYALIGLEFIGNVVHPDRDVIQFGVNTKTGQWAKSYEEMPSNITMDRLLVRAPEATGGHRGILIDGVNMKLLNSDVRGFWEQGRDSQAVGCFQAKGLLIENNYLEGSGENFMCGGVDPAIVNAIPTDLIFRGNWVFKPLSWKSKGGSVKNCFEFKNMRKALVDGNVFQNNWADAQSGSCIVFTVRNQNGGCLWCTIEEITFSNNVILNGGLYAFNILGTDNNFVSAVASKIKILNNLVIGNSLGLQIGVPVNDIEVAHNTFIGIKGSFLSLYPGRLPLVKGSGLNIHDNVASGGQYGLNGDNTGLGIPSLDAFFSTWAFKGNTIEGNVERVITYPPTNTTLPPGTLAGKLDAQKRYLGTEQGTDGKKPGADIDAILSRIPWLVIP